MKPFAPLAVLCLVAACTSVPSDKAVLESSVWNYPLREVVVREVDYHPVEPKGGALIVAPGAHTVTATIGQVASSPRVSASIAFTAEEGHKYRVYGKNVDGQAVLWIKDKTTKKVVAGQAP